MPVIKVNDYIPGQNVANMGINVDYNRIGDDKTSIEIDFTGSPAEVTIKAGSQIASNNSLYKVENDVVITMNGATDNYILFDDTALVAPAWGFSSTIARGTFDPAKQGFYSGVGNTIRTIKWYVDQSIEVINLDLDILNTAGQDAARIKNLNSYKIETGTGVTWFNISSTGNSNTLRVKKSITLVIKKVVGGSGSIDIDLNVKFNGSFVKSFEPVMTGGGFSSTTYWLIALNPGDYQVSAIISGANSTQGYLIGCYGDDAITSPEVYEINP